MPTLKDALDLIGKLTKTEQESLKMILLRPSPTRALDIEEFLTDKKFSNGRLCPYCGKNHIVRNGYRADGTQRYKCKDCNKTFVVASNSIVSGTHKDLDVWQKYIKCMMSGTSIRKAATI